MVIDLPSLFFFYCRFWSKWWRMAWCSFPGQGELCHADHWWRWSIGCENQLTCPDHNRKHIPFWRRVLKYICFTYLRFKISSHYTVLGKLLGKCSELSYSIDFIFMLNQLPYKLILSQWTIKLSVIYLRHADRQAGRHNCLVQLFIQPIWQPKTKKKSWKSRESLLLF